MSLQKRAYSSNSMQSSIREVDIPKLNKIAKEELNTLTDDMILHVATEFRTQFSPNSKENKLMKAEISNRQLEERLKKITVSLPKRRT